MTIITALWVFVLFPLTKKRIEKSGSQETQAIEQLFDDIGETEKPELDINDETEASRPEIEKKEEEPPQARLNPNSDSENESTEPENNNDQSINE